MLNLKVDFGKGWDEISRIMKRNSVVSRDIHNMIYWLQNCASVAVLFFGKESILTTSAISKNFASYKTHAESDETFITMTLVGIETCVNILTNRLLVIRYKIISI